MRHGDLSASLVYIGLVARGLLGAEVNAANKANVESKSSACRPQRGLPDVFPPINFWLSNNLVFVFAGSVAGAIALRVCKVQLSNTFPLAIHVEVHWDIVIQTLCGPSNVDFLPGRIALRQQVVDPTVRRRRRGRRPRLGHANGNAEKCAEHIAIIRFT